MAPRDEVKDRLKDAFVQAYPLQLEDKRMIRTGNSLPEVLQPLQVYIVGYNGQTNGAGLLNYLKFFYDHGYIGAKNIDEADLVVFTGGSDINPKLYGEPALSVTNFNAERDVREESIFWEAVSEGKPMVGICRGGQFLNVMNGGKMWQHVNNHANGKHKAFDLRGKEMKEVEVTSTHHQMMIPPDDDKTKYEILVAASLATEKLSHGREYTRKDSDDKLLSDPEVIWYPEMKCLCFQPHPEFGGIYGQSTADLFWDIFDETINAEIFLENMGEE